MRQLLHARCGRLGDEAGFDVGLYGVMREVAAAAVDAVGRVKEEGVGEETGDVWYSGMLLRLYEVARAVYGAGAEFPRRVYAAAHGSLVADLVREEAMRGGGASAGRRVTLRELVHAAPHVRDVVALYYPECKEHDVAQLLRGARGLRVVDGGSGSCRVEVEEEAGAAEGRGGDGGLVEGGQRLRAMRWRLYTLTRGALESFKKMMDEIGGCMTGRRRAGAGGKSAWRLAPRVVVLDTATLTKRSGRRRYLCLNALCMLLDTLGEQHPATAATLQSMGAAYGEMGSHDTAIMLYERALRIRKDTLGLHPTIAGTIQNMGAVYGDKGQNKKAIELYEQALRIYERTVGRMHRDTADAILHMSTSYAYLGELVKAEKLGREAEEIYRETLGQDNEWTKQARDNLSNIQKAMAKKAGL
jgi:hypothetical protein